MKCPWCGKEIEVKSVATVKKVAVRTRTIKTPPKARPKAGLGDKITVKKAKAKK